MYNYNNILEESQYQYVLILICYGFILHSFSFASATSFEKSSSGTPICFDFNMLWLKKILNVCKENIFLLCLTILILM